MLGSFLRHNVKHLNPIWHSSTFKSILLTLHDKEPISASTTISLNGRFLGDFYGLNVLHVTQSSKQWREDEAITLLSGLASSFLHPQVGFWPKGVAPFAFSSYNNRECITTAILKMSQKQHPQETLTPSTNSVIFWHRCFWKYMLSNGDLFSHST